MEILLRLSAKIGNFEHEDAPQRKPSDGMILWKDHKQNLPLTSIVLLDSQN